MSFKPLGFRDSLNPSTSLKQNFQPLQAPPPLGKSLKPLGQSLQPLGEFLRSPLIQASFGDEEMTSSWFIPDSIMQEDMGTWQEGNTNNSLINLLSPSSPQSPITNYSLPSTQAKLSQDELPFQNAPDLSYGSNATEISFPLKPLGLSKPLVPESNMLISTQTDLPEVIQNKSSIYSQVPQIGKVETSSSSDFIQLSIVTTGNTPDSKLLDLPKINRYNEQRLGFNSQLVSPAFTESLDKTQAKFPEIPNSGLVKANWQESTLAETFTIPSKSPVVQTHLETEETLAQTKQNLAAIPQIFATDGEAIAPAQNPNLIQLSTETPTALPTPEELTSQLQTVVQPPLNLAATSTINTPNQINLIQPKQEKPTALQSPEELASQPQTVEQPKLDLLNTSTTNITAEKPLIPEPQPNLIESKQETQTALSTTQGLTSQPQTLGQPKLDLPDTSTTNITAEKTIVPEPRLNLIQPKQETRTTLSTTQGLASEPQTLGQPKLDSTATSPTNTPAEINLIQPKKETSTSLPTSEELISQPQAVGQPQLDSTAISATNTPAEINLIQPKKEISTSGELTSQRQAVGQTQPNLIATSTTNTIDGKAIAPQQQSNLIQPKKETQTALPIPEELTSQVQAVGQPQLDSTATSATNTPTEINLIQPKQETATSLPTPEKLVSHPKTVRQHKPDLTATSTINTIDEKSIAPQQQLNLIQQSKETTQPPTIAQTQQQNLADTFTTNTVDEKAIAPAAQPNIIQPKEEIPTALLTPEELASQPQTVKQTKINLTATSQTNSIAEKAIAPVQQPNLIQPKEEIPTALPTSEELISEIQTVAQPKLDLTDTLTTNTVDEKAIAPAAQPNIIQPKEEIPNSLLTPEELTSQIKSKKETPTSEELISERQILGQTKPDLADTSTANIVDEKVLSLALQPNLIQPNRKTSTALPTSEKLTSQTQIVGQTKLDLTDTSTTNTVDEKAIVPQQQSNLIQPKKETSTALPTSEELISESITAPQNIIQPRLDKSLLNHIKPLGISKPLSQKSDFMTSGLVDDLIDKSPSISQNLLPSDSSLPTKGNPPDSGENISQPKGNPSNELKDDLTSIKPLGFSNSLNSPNNFILPKLDLTGATGKKPQTIGFDDISDRVQEPSSNTIPDSIKDIPISWSSISELLGKSSKTENNTVPEKHESTHLSSPSYTLFSPFSSHSSHSETADADSSNSNGEVSQKLTKESFPKNNSTENEQLDILAQKVYTLMRQSLEITQERHGREIVGNPIWLSNITSIYGTATTNSDVISPLDAQLQELTQKVSLLLQKRFEIDRERRGRYYAGRLPW